MCALPIFEGLLPPVSLAPCFAIRKPAARVYTLVDYVADQVMLPLQGDAMKRAVRERRNTLLAGVTSSGNTTVANALLVEITQVTERVVLFEDRESVVEGKSVVVG